MHEQLVLCLAWLIPPPGLPEAARFLLKGDGLSSLTSLTAPSMFFHQEQIKAKVFVKEHYGLEA